MASTCLLVASAVAQCAPAILNAGITLQIPIILLHLIGGILGYWIPKVMNYSEVGGFSGYCIPVILTFIWGFLDCIADNGDRDGHEIFCIRIPLS